MVPYLIKAAVGEDCSGLKIAPAKGCWANYMVHSKTTGKYKSIWFAPGFKENHLIEFVTDLKPGDKVHEFRDAQDALGEMILRFDNTDQMFGMLKNMDSYVRIQTE